MSFSIIPLFTCIWLIDCEVIVSDGLELRKMEIDYDLIFLEFEFIYPH